MDDAPYQPIINYLVAFASGRSSQLVSGNDNYIHPIMSS